MLKLYWYYIVWIIMHVESQIYNNTSQLSFNRIIFHGMCLWPESKIIDPIKLQYAVFYVAL